MNILFRIKIKDGSFSLSEVAKREKIDKKYCSRENALCNSREQYSAGAIFQLTTYFARSGNSEGIFPRSSTH